MKRIVCPKCGSLDFFHFTDAYVRRVPYLKEDGEIALAESETDEFDDRFFECCACGVRLEEDDPTGRPAQWVADRIEDISVRFKESVLQVMPLVLHPHDF